MFNDQGFEILISSDLQYEELCSEIYFEDQLVALITRENGLENAIIEIFPPSNSENWSFDCARFLKTVEKATSTLIRTDENPKPNKKSSNFGKFNVVLKDLPYKKNGKTEIFYDHLYLGEISGGPEGLIIQFNGKSLKSHSEFKVDEIVSAITKGKELLR